MHRSLIPFALVSTLAAASPNVGNSLWYDKPAATWLEAHPVGNGSLGGMIFGAINNERIQFNEQTLWTGDEIEMGTYQPLGDVLIDSADLGNVTGYRRELDLAGAIHRTTFTSRDVLFTREVFSSHPDKVIVIRLTADKPAAISCTIRLTDMHKAAVSASGDTLTANGSLENGLEYSSRVKILYENGQLTVSDSSLTLRKVDSATILLAGATDFANSPTTQWRGERPAPKLDRILAAASNKSYDQLKSAYFKKPGFLTGSFCRLMEKGRLG